MKGQIFAFTLISLVLTLTFSSSAQSNISVLQFPELGSSISVIACCYTLDSEINVIMAINDVTAGFRTPCTFNFSNETLSISVPKIDQCGHPFVAWNTGEKNPSITISAEGVYVAYYAKHPPSLQYNAVISTSSNGEGNINVNVTKDCNLTYFDTPCTFTGLTGIHTFTVPFIDSNGNKFTHWIGSSDTLSYSTTIIVSSGGTYTACYDVGMCKYVTPSDSTIVEAAKNKSWIEMLDYVSSKINYGNNSNWQMPNETLSLGYGQCRDYATLYVSMLRSRGYEAYVAVGTKNVSGTEKRHAWAVFNLNEDLFHVDPQWDAYNQRFLNFTLYESEYCFDESRVVTPVSSSNLPLLPDQGDGISVFSVSVLAVILLVATSFPIFVGIACKKNTFKRAIIPCKRSF